MSLLNSMPDGDEFDPKREAELHIFWHDRTLEASSWWSLDRITPLQAAALLCKFNPDDDANDPELVTNSETGPDDFKRLRREFNCVAEADAKPRTLSQWHTVAHDRGLKHHSWIDKYKAAKELCATEKPEQAKSEAQGGTAGTDRPALMARHKELTAAGCKSVTATLASEFGISDRRVRAIKKEEQEKPRSGMAAMAHQLTPSKVHKIVK